MRGQLWIVAAPSGGGKTSLIAQAVERLDYVVESVSHTTRPPRAGEIDGTHYHFVAAQVFAEMVKKGDFLEWATVFDYAYGTSGKTVDALLESGLDVILNIDWQGAQQICARRPDTRTVFLLPPSLEALRVRLTKRGQDDLAVVERRMAQAKEQISHYKEFDYVIVNDDFDNATQALLAILSSARLERKRCEGDLQPLLQQLGQH